MRKIMVVSLITLTIGMVGCGSKPQVEEPVTAEVESVTDQQNETTPVEEVIEPEDILDSTIEGLNEKYSKKLYGTLSFDGDTFIFRSNNNREFYKDDAAKLELLKISKDIYDTISNVYDNDVYYMFTTSDYSLVSIAKIDGVYYTMCFEELINDLTTYVER